MDTINLAPPRGKFSRIREICLGQSRLLFISGVAASVSRPASLAEQTVEVFSIIDHLLKSKGSSLNDLVKITTYLSDMKYYSEYNEVRDEIFTDFQNPPASATVQALLVEESFFVEIEAVAFVAG